MLARIGAFLAPYLLPAAGIVLVGALIWGALGHVNARHWHKRFDTEHQKRIAEAQAFVAAQDRARAIALEAARNREAAYANIQKEADHEVTLARADYDARLRKWMRDHANQGAAGSANLSAPAESSGATDDAAGAAFLVSGTDLHRCTNAYAIAEGWQRWWTEIEKSGDR